MDRRICSYYGYVWIRVSDNHPVFKGWVREHHYVWYEAYKQKVGKGYVLHHKDENKQNNALENLELLSRAEHCKLHATGKKYSEERLEKARRIAKLRSSTPEWRKEVSERARRQHAEGNLGRATWGPETAKIVSEKLKGRVGVMLGKHHSEETKAKIASAHRGVPKTPQHIANALAGRLKAKRKKV